MSQSPKNGAKLKPELKNYVEEVGLKSQSPKNGAKLKQLNLLQYQKKE